MFSLFFIFPFSLLLSTSANFFVVVNSFSTCSLCFYISIYFRFCLTMHIFFAVATSFSICFFAFHYLFSFCFGQPVQLFYYYNYFPNLLSLFFIFHFFLFWLIMQISRYKSLSLEYFTLMLINIKYGYTIKSNSKKTGSRQKLQNLMVSDEHFHSLWKPLCCSQKVDLFQHFFSLRTALFCVNYILVFHNYF